MACSLSFSTSLLPKNSGFMHKFLWEKLKILGAKTFDHGVNGLLIVIRNWMQTNHYVWLLEKKPFACKNGTLQEPALCTIHHANFRNTLQNFSKFNAKFFEIIFEMFRYDSRKFPKYFSKFLHKIILEVFWNNFLNSLNFPK